MELHKIEDVDFTINHDPNSEPDINLVWKEGQLYLSLKNIVLTDGKRWYDLPIEELENIRVISENPTRLSFRLPSLEVIVTGKYAERLLALRHLLLPLLHKKRKKIMKDCQKDLIRFWSIGVKTPAALATLLPLSSEEIRNIIAQTKEEKLITMDGNLTEKAYEMFSTKERELLQCLEVKND
jgi:hypothetical protein